MNALKLAQQLGLASLSADPTPTANGAIYYNNSTNKLRARINGAWADLATSAIVLTGQALNDGEILVGNASNVSAAIDTDTVGDITADHAAGLTIKSDVITNTHVNSAAAIAYSKLNLSNSIVNADINASAAIAYSKLNLATSIVNADVAAAAAIARSKLASGTAHRVVVNDASGVLSDAAAITAARALISDANGIPTHSAVTDTELGHVSGVTSAIQTQLNAKAADNIVIKKDGTVTYTANQPMGSFKLTGLAAGSSAGDSVRYEQAILASGANAFAANQSLGGFKITSLGSPTASTDAANKSYVDSVAEGLKPKAAVRVASTANVVIASALENGDSLDGITLATGNRVLLKDQSTASQNGIYVVVASGAASRSTDFDSLSPIDEINGAMVAVQEGTANAGKVFVQTGTVAVLDTDAINFVFFNSSSSLVGGDGITVSGSNISVDHDGEGLQFVSTQLALELDASTLSKSASGLKVATGGISNNEVNASAAIAYSKLNLSNSILNADINASAAIAYSKLNLATSIVNADVNASAAIAYSKLNLSASIVNADIAAAAAIALNKLAAVTASRALQSDASGFISASSVTSTELGHVSGVTSAIQTQLDDKASKALSNLASVAINTSLISDTNNTDDLGSDAIEWKDAYVHAIKHGDATNPNLSISTTSNNGSLNLVAHGTGNLDIDSNKVRRSKDLSNFIEEEYLDAETLTASQTNTVLASLTFAHASFEGFEMEYKIKEATSNKVRIGKLMVVTNGTDVVYSDQYTESADIGTAFRAVINGANVEIDYTTTANNKIMRADCKRFRA